MYLNRLSSAHARTNMFEPIATDNILIDWIESADETFLEYHYPHVCILKQHTF